MERQHETGTGQEGQMDRGIVNKSDAAIAQIILQASTLGRGKWALALQFLITAAHSPPVSHRPDWCGVSWRK